MHYTTPSLPPSCFPNELHQSPHKSFHTPLAHLHRGGGQHEEGEQKDERPVDVCDAVPLLWVASDTCESHGDDQTRHDERRDHDDVKVGDEINCSVTKERESEVF